MAQDGLCDALEGADSEEGLEATLLGGRKEGDKRDRGEANDMKEGQRWFDISALMVEVL